MKVSAIIVTRGDVELESVIDSLPRDWEVVVWDNGARRISRSDGWAEVCDDLAVYGRYAAIEYATGDVIYVQDDDVIVSDPAEIVATLERCYEVGPFSCEINPPVVCNMPPEFRHAFYHEHALVGFGAAFRRDVPERAFTRFALSSHRNGAVAWGTDGMDRSWFDRTCDIVFTGLTSRVLVDIPRTNLPYASDDNRMWRQAEHVDERAEMLRLVRSVA